MRCFRGGGVGAVPFCVFCRQCMGDWWCDITLSRAPLSDCSCEDQRREKLKEQAES